MCDIHHSQMVMICCSVGKDQGDKTENIVDVSDPYLRPNEKFDNTSNQLT